MNKLFEQVVNNLKAGVFARITYKTELPVKAAYKNQGFKVVKTTSSTVRFGINYRNIKSVIERKNEVEEDSKKTWTNNYIEVIKNKISFNTSTNKFYLNVYPIKKGNNSNSTYILIYPDGFEVVGDINFIKEYVIPSYFNKSQTEMFRVNVDNVLSINDYLFN